MGSFSAVLLLLIVTRWAGLYAAGVFSLATAVGQQLQTLGAYEVRPYQATDVRFKYLFGTYYGARLITVSLMAIGILVYGTVFGSSPREVIALILVAGLRIFDALEDVFYGEFQRRLRLDVAGRINFVRVLVTTVVFSAALIARPDLVVASSVTIFVSLAVLVALLWPAARELDVSLRPEFNLLAIRDLLYSCSPLFLAAFLAMYLTNAPRFAIEEYMTKDDQGVYAVLFIPALAINILAMFIFRPLLTRMALRWKAKEISEFRRLIVLGLEGVLVAFVVTVVVVYFAGIPVLEFLYDVELDSYSPELVILVVGGGFNASGVILYYALTTMRRQKLVLVGYLISSASVLVFSKLLVNRYGMTGASVSYTVAMFILVCVFGVTFMISSRYTTTH